MANNLNLNILSDFATTTTSLNLVHCIESFDIGFNNIYIIDEDGEYSGFAVTKDSFKKIWKSIDDSFVNVPGIIEHNDNEKILQQSLQIFAKNPELTEIPILKNNRIISIITYVLPKQPEGFIWSNIADNNLSPDMRNYKKIYLSSLENQDILNFYNCFSTRLPLIPLGNDNLMEALNDEENLLIYIEDLFPKRNNKLSVIDLWNKLVIYALNQMKNFCYISSEYATVKQSESQNLALFVQKFDQGFHSVYIVDENDNDNFVATVLRSKFREDFPKRNFRRWNNLYINYSDNEEELKFEIAKWCFGTSRKELPMLLDRKVVYSGVKGHASSLQQNKEDIFPPIYWEIIDDDLAKEFFKDQKKVLISSEFGNLNGFRKKFEKMLDITVYDDSVMEKYLSNEFDILIYSSNIWFESKTIKYDARQLYRGLLNKQLSSYLMNKGVTYYYFGYNNTSTINLEQRIDTKNVSVRRPPFIFGSVYDDYYVHADNNDDDWISTNGIRRIVKTLPHFEHKIYFFGPCITVGTFVNDNDTIESYLQELINDNNLSYKVINCGNHGGFTGQSINHLYRIMDTNFSQGDIVIHFDVYDIQNDFIRKDAKNYFEFSTIINDAEIKNCKMFIGKTPYHLNAEGNKIVAEFLWEKLKDKLSEKVEQPRHVVPALFSIMPPLAPLEYGSRTASLLKCA